MACSASCLRAVHLAEAPVALGVVRVELDGARRVLDGVVVVVDLERVLRHALVELARALRLDLGELARARRWRRRSCSPARARARARGSSRRRPAASSMTLPQRRLGVRQPAQVQLRLGEHAPRLEVRRRARRTAACSAGQLRARACAPGPRASRCACGTRARAALSPLLRRLGGDLLVEHGAPRGSVLRRARAPRRAPS